MALELEDRPGYQLTRHFFRALFDFGILSDAGADAVRRLLIGLVAVMVSLGLLLTRMYLQKYALLSERFHDWGSGYRLNLEPYRLAVLGDGTLVIAFPMLIVAFAVVLVSDALFPSQIDGRVLLPLGVSKRALFASKALAVMLFAGLFAIGAQVAMMPLVVLMGNSRWSDRSMSMQLVAHAVASLGGSIVAALGILAIAGVLLVAVPRSRLQAASIAVRGVFLFALVLSIPLVCRLPTSGALIARESPLFYLVPPVWFLGIEQWVLGRATPYFIRLAQIGAAAGVVSCAVAIGSYVFLYRRLERVIFRATQTSDPAHRQRRRLPRRRTATAAIGPFVAATLRRSPFHQGVFVIISAGGAGLVLNGLLSEWHAAALSTADEALVATVVWSAFALVFTMNVAVRAALVLPIELRANWIFRMTEDDATRAAELSAVVRTLILLGVVLPLAMIFPLEWAVLGPRAIQCTSVAALGGLVLVELQMTEWAADSFHVFLRAEPAADVAHDGDRRRRIRAVHGDRLSCRAVQHQSSGGVAGGDDLSRRCLPLPPAPTALGVGEDDTDVRGCAAERSGAAQAVRVLTVLLADHLHHDLATTGAGVELDDHDLLPGAERQRAADERDRQRRSE